MTQIPQSLPELQQQYPELYAQLMNEAVYKPVQTAENELGAGQGEAKKQRAIGLSDEFLTRALNGAYDLADLFAGFPGPVDLLVKQLIIPALPELIDQAAALLHRMGVFKRQEPGQ